MFEASPSSEIRIFIKDNEFISLFIDLGFPPIVELTNLLTLKPQCAILDEIDTGLDSNGLKLVVGIINDRKKENLATIVITHNISTVQNLDYDYGLMFKDSELIEVDNETVVQKLKDGYD